MNAKAVTGVKNYLITHYYHSGFSAACGDTLLVFDYWRGENGELAEDLQLTPEELAKYAHVYVLVSHDHPDHLDPVIFTWKDLPGVKYIIASDMRAGTPGQRMAPGDTLELEGDVRVTAYDSTDLGVSYLVSFAGLSLFHAGDLNFWHWRDESSMKEIEEADAEFRKALAPLAGVPVDVAFFPVDPRQGSMFEAGANYFILTVKPRILIPMHYFRRADTAMEYAQAASCRATEVIALPGYGEMLNVEEDEEGFLNLSFPERLSPGEEEEAPEEEYDPLMEEDNPFLESDLPLPQLAEIASPEKPADESSGETPPDA